ncbi:MAG: RNA-binding S4 domain-containing protein [Bacteroidales bacterium]|jgi:ribosome-associated heat shock protein Hsp15
MNDNLVQTVRIDKYLWAVRIYKTRGQATSACKMGRILVNGNPVKPSKNIEGNEIITVRKPPVMYSYKVIRPLSNRIPAKMVESYLIDLTPDSEKEKLSLKHTDPFGYRKKGEGRPTKKERRIIDKWRNHFEDL